MWSASVRLESWKSDGKKLKNICEDTFTNSFFRFFFSFLIIMLCIVPVWTSGDPMFISWLKNAPHMACFSHKMNKYVMCFGQIEIIEIWRELSRKWLWSVVHRFFIFSPHHFWTVPVWKSGEIKNIRVCNLLRSDWNHRNLTGKNQKIFVKRPSQCFYFLSFLSLYHLCTVPVRTYDEINEWTMYAFFFGQIVIRLKSQKSHGGGGKSRKYLWSVLHHFFIFSVFLIFFIFIFLSSSL